MNEYQTQILESYLTKQGLLWKREAALSAYCTFQIGGPAEYVIWPDTEEALARLLRFLDENGMCRIVLGNGSNVLFSDQGYHGAVVFTSRMKNVYADGTHIYADSGAGLTTAAVCAMKRSLAGMEFAYGIPGSCGGAVYMNAGAFQGEMKDIVVSSRYYDAASGEIRTLDAAAHAFAYRGSFYMGTKHVILGVVFSLREGDGAAIREKMEEYMRYRTSSQPLELPSAGSVFKRYPGYYTSKLIEEAGLKGKCVGGAQVSEKHAGFIVNTGGATARDVLTLIEIVKGEIYKNHGIQIECEVQYIGEDGREDQNVFA